MNRDRLSRHAETGQQPDILGHPPFGKLRLHDNLIKPVQLFWYSENLQERNALWLEWTHSTCFLVIMYTRWWHIVRQVFVASQTQQQQVCRSIRHPGPRAYSFEIDFAWKLLSSKDIYLFESSEICYCMHAFTRFGYSQYEKILTKATSYHILSWFNFVQSQKRVLLFALLTVTEIEIAYVIGVWIIHGNCRSSIHVSSSSSYNKRKQYALFHRTCSVSAWNAYSLKLKMIWVYADKIKC